MFVSVFIALVVIGAALYLSYLIAKSFYAIACDKGYSDRKYFHFCFWLGLPGWIMVAALPANPSAPGLVWESNAPRTGNDGVELNDLKKMFEKGGERVLRVIPYIAEGPDRYQQCDHCRRKMEEVLWITTVDHLGTHFKHTLCHDCLADFYNEKQ